jgi:hypothetical protein
MKTPANPPTGLDGLGTATEWLGDPANSSAARIAARALAVGLRVPFSNSTMASRVTTARRAIPHESISRTPGPRGIAPARRSEIH